MDEKEEQRLRKWYDECDSDDAMSLHDPYSTDEDSDFEVNRSELEESSSDSDNDVRQRKIAQNNQGRIHFISKIWLEK